MGTGDLMRFGVLLNGRKKLVMLSRRSNLDLEMTDILFWTLVVAQVPRDCACSAGLAPRSS